ncbi:MAG: RNA-binding protein [Bacteroidetes bacterium]|nr:MAG: RNA-binding protein [Bacteroidota bacterium]
MFRIRSTSRRLWSGLLIALAVGCGAPDHAAHRPAPAPLFQRLPPERTGIAFRNTLSEHPSPHRNVLLFEYFSNGSGVAVGDVNGDGLDDLYFGGNMTYNRLYLNRGNLTFEDVTEAAGVAGRVNTWKTGVTMADVNGDGRLDLYVGYSGDLPLDRRVDELYINLGVDDRGIPRFEEQAHAYGLDRPHSTNQAYFFDYDRDGDLDLLLLTHNVRQIPRMDRAGTQQQLREDDPVNGVRFYRNEGARFVDVTRQAGFVSSPLTYGLGAGIADIDQDGWLDVYIGNDYSPPDYLYMNQGDGTFADELAERIDHTSHASMGVDVADLDNDGWAEIMVLDMLAPDPRRQKTLFVPEDRDLFQMFVDVGFHHQYLRNTLQWNHGDGTFSEIGQLAGVASTDWSWAPLLADYDNDGLKDIVITNGTLRDNTHRDFLAYKNRYALSRRYDLEPADVAHLLEVLPASTVPNVAFRNGGAWRFEDVTAAWGLGEPMTSTGAAYADLDNDGDLDLILNNINAPAAIFENRAADGAGHAYLQVELRGETGNTAGIGARLTLYAGGMQQYLEQMPMRGYLSTVSPVLHFGLGPQAAADSLQVIWPDGRQQTLYDVPANQRLTLYQRDATPRPAPAPPPSPLFVEVPSPIPFEHRMAGPVDDFRRQPLMVNAQSLVGPPLARADVNGDGLDDVFAGGGVGQAGRLYLQQPDGRFVAASPAPFAADAPSHDAAAVFVDADADGDPDLYVASRGYGAFAPQDAALQDRLYLNDGRGGFTRQEDALPPMPTSTGTVAVTDVDGNGWPDLFVGGYVVPGRYPEPPRSYVLVNDGTGRFEDRTADLAPALQHVGMVRAAAWHDLDADGTPELIVAGLWMPIRIFSADGGVLHDRTDRYFERPLHGLWSALLVQDLNGDGRLDLLAGNLGLNTQLHASVDQPAELYYADFDANGSVDPILALYIQGTSYPFATLEALRDQLPRVALRFDSHEAYARAQIGDLLSPRELEQARVWRAETLETTLFLGRDGGGFVRAELPIAAQLAPVFALHASDVDADGITDLLLAGNLGDAPVRLGRYDANHGVLLRGLGGGRFAYVPQRASGFRLRGDVRSILSIQGHLIFGLHQAALRAYAPATPAPAPASSPTAAAGSP